MSAISDAPIIILGGTGPSGSYFLRHLQRAGMVATIVSRRSFDAPQGFTSLLLDLNKPGDWRAPQGCIVISLLPIWLLTNFLPQLVGAKAVIATSSTSRYSKEGSGDAHEREIAEKLVTGEEALQNWVEKNGADWTILRPTLIYDGKTDKNITRMAKFIRRWHFLPMVLPSNGRRQPIHTDDVAKAIFTCIGNASVANKAFNISGGEILTYRQMAERVFAALGQKPHFVLLPVPLLKVMFKLASMLGIVREAAFGASMFQRMNEDLVFETSTGLEAMAHAPRKFDPHFDF